MKGKIKIFLEKYGWFIRKQQGLSIGINFFYDLEHKFKIKPLQIFDVGAHKGETINLFLQYFSEIKITGFEPVKSNFSVLNNIYGNLSNINLENLALSNMETEIEIELQADSQTNSLRNLNINKNANSEIIKATTLDHYVKKNKIEKIDILKLDVEGFELNVLEGASNFMDSGKIESIFLECSLDSDDKVHSNLILIQNYLGAKKYRLVGIYDQVSWKNPSKLAYFNAFFIKE